MTGDRESRDSGLPSKYNIDTAEDREILLLKNEGFEMVSKTIPAFNEFVNTTLTKNITVLPGADYVSISFSAEEK